MSKGSQVVARDIAAAAAMFAIGFLSIANAAGPSVAPTPPPRPVSMDRNSAIILIRSALIAVQQANQTGNYSVLYGLSAPGFQSVNSADRLSQIFANLRGKNFDLSGVLVLEPEYTVLPEIYSNDVMRMAGFFPSAPLQVYFDLQFAPVQGQWRIVALGVDIGPATPVAPTPNPALASSHSPSPAASASPSATATTSPPTVEVRPPAKATPTPHKSATAQRQSLGRP